MNFQERINRSIGKQRKTPLKAFHEIIFVLGKEMGWSPREVLESPMPLVLGVMDELQAHFKREAKANKKR